MMIRKEREKGGSERIFNYCSISPSTHSPSVDCHWKQRQSKCWYCSSQCESWFRLLCPPSSSLCNTRNCASPPSNLSAFSNGPGTHYSAHAVTMPTRLACPRRRNWFVCSHVEAYVHGISARRLHRIPGWMIAPSPALKVGSGRISSVPMEKWDVCERDVSVGTCENCTASWKAARKSAPECNRFNSLDP